MVEIMKITGGAPLDFFRRVAKMAPTPMPRSWMKAMGEAVMGDTAGQRAALKWLREHPELVERAGAIGAAYEG